ncbi:hypothetical protein QBL07_012110 [Gordonia rubripertincta]|uniref:hypothetical protein n=1 Tax=Gordonia rubripertincta TaxID=36822 RepID=UPI000586EE8E
MATDSQPWNAMSDAITTVASTNPTGAAGTWAATTPGVVVPREKSSSFDHARTTSVRTSGTSPMFTLRPGVGRTTFGG